MEIKNNINAISAYKMNSYDINKKNSKISAPSSKNVDNVDKVEFSSKSRNVESLKASISSSVKSSSSDERISKLRQLIANNQYNVSADMVANSILD